MLQKLREHLALVLLTLLPLHALLVTAGTKVIAGPGHAPLTTLALWKEGLLALILLIACIELLSRLKTQDSRLTKLDLPDLLILSLIALSFLVPLLTGNWKLETSFAHGFRYDFVPLISFLLLRRVSWSDRFKQLLPMLLLGIGALIATYGIISFFLPAGFFTWLGYSDLHSLYVPDGPVAAFQQIGSTGLRRIQSTLSGPNHLGLWLLIPWSICLTWLVSQARGGGHPRTAGGCEGVECMADKRKKAYLVVASILAMLFAIALLLTFSRAAWIGAAAISIVTLLQIVPRAKYAKVLMMCGGIVILISLLLTLAFPTTILRIASSRDHLIRPMEAVRTMIEHPLGLGLGSAGPASNRTSDPCVFLEAGSDPSWAKDRPNLCVFVDNVQVQPIDRTCRCPFLPENWYLQIGVELGWIGFVLFLILTLAILFRTHGGVRLHHPATNHFAFHISHFAFLSFLAISIAALFLHAWEDMAVAVTVWMAVAVALPSGTLRPWNSRFIPAASSSSTSADSTRI